MRWPVGMHPGLYKSISYLDVHAMAPYSSTLAWKIPWMEEPGGLQSMGSLRVGHDWATSLSLSCLGEGNGNPLQYSCLENPRDGGVWWAAVYGVPQSRIQLKRLSSSSSSSMCGKSLQLCPTLCDVNWKKGLVNWRKRVSPNIILICAI